MRTRAGALLGLVVVTTMVVAIGAAPASAAETRADYVAQTDRICKDALRDLKQVFRKYGPIKIADPDDDGTKASKKELRKGLRQLARLFGSTNRLFGHMVRRISFVAIPSGDERAVLDWLAGMRAYKRFSDRANLALKRGQLVKWFMRLGRATESLQNGALAVKDFGYRNCPAGDLTGEAQVASSAARAYAHSIGS